MGQIKEKRKREKGRYRNMYVVLLTGSPQLAAGSWFFKRLMLLFYLPEIESPLVTLMPSWKMILVTSIPIKKSKSLTSSFAPVVTPKTTKWRSSA